MTYDLALILWLAASPIAGLLIGSAIRAGSAQ